VREITAAAGHPALVGVDGGLTLANAAEVAGWGADLAVSGSAIFDGKDAPGNLAAMLAALGAPAAQTEHVPAASPGGSA
jgi:pentose-5-phosphate-3-epimerase